MGKNKYTSYQLSKSYILEQKKHTHTREVMDLILGRSGAWCCSGMWEITCKTLSVHPTPYKPSNPEPKCRENNFSQM